MSKTIPLRRATYEELMEVITDLHTQNYLKEMEIVRLNNIINELENWLAKEYISGCYEDLYRIGLQDSYDKLQELKGSDKE